MITFSLAGNADRVLADGSYRTDEPQIWQRYNAHRTTRRVGRSGYLATVTLDAADWLDICDYLASVEGALDAALSDTLEPDTRRSTWADLTPVRRFLDRATETLPDVAKFRR